MDPQVIRDNAVKDLREKVNSIERDAPRVGVDIQKRIREVRATAKEWKILEQEYDPAGKLRAVLSIRALTETPGNSGGD